MNKIIAGLCWLYGRLIILMILRPMWETIIFFNLIERDIYNHARKIRGHWDSYKFKIERDGL
jgi:hypothetical protein